jgi:hypothetical protein
MPAARVAQSKKPSTSLAPKAGIIRALSTSLTRLLRWSATGTAREEGWVMGEAWLRRLLGTALLLIAAALLALEVVTARIATERPASAEAELDDQLSPWPAIAESPTHVAIR